MVTKTTSSSASITSSKPEILIRRAHLYEAPALGKIAAETYSISDPLVAFLSPYRAEHYSDYERGFIQRSWKRMLDPRNLTFVAVLSSNPSIPVGYTQFVRMGDDSGAKRQIASRDGVLLRIFAWVFWVYSLVLPWIVGKDRSADPDRVKAFEASHGDVDTEYWNRQERKNRWHATSVVVKQEWQGRGIGKMLMAEIVARAEEEGVVVGLEASGPGEQLYRRVGFELLGRLKDNFAGQRDDSGGVMIYTPSTLKKT